MAVNLEWWHIAVTTTVATVAGAAARGPGIARNLRRTIENLVGKELTEHVRILKENEAARQLADASRVGGMVALGNVVNEALARVQGLAEKTEAAELAANKMIKDFNGLGERVKKVEVKTQEHEQRLQKIEHLRASVPEKEN